MKGSKPPIRENRLLAALPGRSRRLFMAGCEQIDLRFADVVCESGERIRHVYFPTDSFLSLLTTLDDGARLEVGIVGDEGMVGMSLALGIDVSPQHVLVQGAGAAWRMSASDFRDHLEQSSALRHRVDRYIHLLMSQLAQTAACARYHVVEARLARWLLLTRDRAHADQFRLTHEFLAYMLGVRRAGITRAASMLHARGLIDYSRGEISILDSARLESASCSCYRQAIDMYEQALGSTRNSTRRPITERQSVQRRTAPS
jgi:CRP-like cAMP-binding protein